MTHTDDSQEEGASWMISQGDRYLDQMFYDSVDNYFVLFFHCNYIGNNLVKIWHQLAK